MWYKSCNLRGGARPTMTLGLKVPRQYYTRRGKPQYLSITLPLSTGTAEACHQVQRRGRGDYGRTQSEYRVIYESYLLETGRLLSYDRPHRQGL
eukprot:2169546-Pleurochrysis_carterae.AAC.1